MRTHRTSLLFPPGVKLSEHEIQIKCKEVMSRRRAVVDKIPIWKRLFAFSPFLLSILAMLSYGFFGDPTSASTYGVTDKTHGASWIAVIPMIYYALWLTWFLWRGVTTIMAPVDRALLELGVSDRQLIRMGANGVDSIFKVFAFHAVFIVFVYQVLFEGTGGMHFIYVSHDILSLFKS